MILVWLTLAFGQMMILALLVPTVARVSFLLMKSVAGELPVTPLAANVEAFGFQDALGQNIG
jgi:hypothetical protein